MDVDDAIAAHEIALGVGGGTPGLRDEGLLESAVMKIQNSYEVLSLAHVAAVYIVAVVKNHAFFDANKRTAWILAETFLRANGVPVALDHASQLRARQRQGETAAAGRWLDIRDLPSPVVDLPSVQGPRTAASAQRSDVGPTAATARAGTPASRQPSARPFRPAICSPSLATDNRNSVSTIDA